jgi:hypothetical protein
VARKIIVLLLSVVILALSGIGQNAASSFSLSVKLDSRYNRDLTVCTTVRAGEPFKVMWSHENVRSSISGVLQEQAEGRYPLRLTVDQHLSDIKSGSEVTHGYKLETGKWKNENYVMSSSFKDFEDVGVLLLNGECSSGSPGSD